MNCPQCGNAVEPEQRFCRECGTRLLADVPNRVRMGGMAVLTLIFVGLMVAIFGKMFEMKWLAYTGLAVMMTGAFLIAAYGMIRETRPRKSRPPALKAKSPVVSVEKVDTTNKLLPIGQADYIPSVVENTTDLLQTPLKR
jgi:predicted nucleic acid-binding Zn ribbon protein